MNILNYEGFKVKNIGIFTVDGSGNYYLQEYGEKFKTGKIPLKEEFKW